MTGVPRTAREVAALLRVSGVYSPERVKMALARVSRRPKRVGVWADVLARAGEPGAALALLLWTPQGGW